MNPISVEHVYKNSNYKNIQVPSHPIFKPKFQVFDSTCVESQKPHAQNQKPCGKGFEIVGSGEKDLRHADGIKPHPNGRFLKVRGMTRQGYPQCSHTSWKIYGFYLELLFVQIAKYLVRTFNGKSEPCLCGGKAAISTVFVELPQELTKEISSFMNLRKEKCSSTSRGFFSIL